MKCKVFLGYCLIFIFWVYCVSFEENLKIKKFIMFGVVEFLLLVIKEFDFLCCYGVVIDVIVVILIKMNYYVLVECMFLVCLFECVKIGKVDFIINVRGILVLD